MTKKNVGIIGSTGRMGLLLQKALLENDYYQLGVCINRKSTTMNPFQDVFELNDYIVDFSSHTLVSLILEEALECPKPLVLCTTGWDQEEYLEKLNHLATRVPVVLAPNTSLGACLQVYLSKRLAEILDSSYDIHIHEKHHRYKLDAPSGTALNLYKEIKKTKNLSKILTDDNTFKSKETDSSPYIGVTSERQGNLPGEHTITFTNEGESLSITHVALNRSLFISGTLKILDWLRIENPLPGLYTTLDVFKI